MIFQNSKVYEALKFVAQIVLPALATLVVAIFSIWDIPYGEAISGTIIAVDTFMGALLHISANEYKKIEEAHNEDKRDL